MSSRSVTGGAERREASRELLRILRGLTDINLVGADVVEVAPACDHAEITAIAAATVIFDMITLMALHRGRGG